MKNRLIVFGLVLACCGLMQAAPLTVINKTKGDIGFIALDKPFNRSDANRLSLRWLGRNQQTTFHTRERLLGWHRAGFNAGFTVIEEHDRIIAFVEHGGAIKTLHGAQRVIELSNPKYEPLTFETKNPQHGAQDCRDCAQDCYDVDRTVAYCDCLDWCWDRTKDMSWYLHPGDRINVDVGAGTKIGVYQEAADDEDYLCEDGLCDTIVMKKTIRRYY